MNNYCVKARKKDGKSWAFVTPQGYLNRLRVHAAQMTEEKAHSLVAEVTALNEEYEFKAQELWKE